MADHRKTALRLIAEAIAKAPADFNREEMETVKEIDIDRVVDTETGSYEYSITGYFIQDVIYYRSETNDSPEEYTARDEGVLIVEVGVYDRYGEEVYYDEWDERRKI